METETKTTPTMIALGRALQRAGPYVLIEILLPGGTLLALFLLLYRHGPAKVAADARRLGAAALQALRPAVAPGSTSRPTGRAGWRGLGLPRDRDGLEPLGFAPD